MKSAGKITILLSAVVVTASLSLWFWRSSPPPRNLAETQAPTKHTLIPATATPSATVAQAPVPASVQPIVAAASASSFTERVKIIRALPVDLTDEEIQAFYVYLLMPAPAGTENRQQENWLRNEMMDKLAGDPVLPAGLARVLIAIYQDPTQDIVMRDYAVQHMSPVYALASAQEKATLQQTLWSALAESDSSIAGTALLALRDLAQDHREFEPNKLGEAALKLAGDDRSGELSRITALQICGRMGINQATPLMLQLAREAESVPLQIAAIAALGDVGNEEARIYLRQLSVQPEPRLRAALETALKKLNERLGI